MKRKGARLGQHFLTNPHVAEKLVDAALIQPTDTVLEIGPGTGALTRKLLESGAHVIAIEKDEVLVMELARTFVRETTSGQLTLVPGDVRDFDPHSAKLDAGRYVLAANIPYYITGEIIRQFLTAEVQPRTIALLIQKEVADRIVAGDGKESILSLSVKAYGKPRVIAKVSAGNFSPPPSVDSAILVIEKISRDFFSGMSEDVFFRAVKAGFASKRKFLLKNLSLSFQLSDVRNAFQACALPENVRAEDVPLESWRKLSRHLSATDN